VEVVVVEHATMGCFALAMVNVVDTAFVSLIAAVEDGLNAVKFMIAGIPTISKSKLSRIAQLTFH
jgi:hypothetical protein